MNSITQVSDGIKESTGLDISHILSGFLGGKIASKTECLEENYED